MNWFKAKISDEKRGKILNEFENMTGSYSSKHIESDKLVKEWLKSKISLGSFVNGIWVVDTKETHIIANACTGEELAVVHLADEQLTNRAISSAEEASKAWSALSSQQRGRHLYDVARSIQAHQELFALLESMCVGKPIRRTRAQDIPFLVRSFFHFSGLAVVKKSQVKNLRPKGLAYIISACHNNPFMMCWHVSAALASGNAVILEVDAQECLSALLLAEVARTAGLPVGVLNVLPTKPPKLHCYSIAPSLHMKVFFSGSFSECQKIREWADEQGIAIECCAAVRPTVIVLDGADQHSAVSGILECFCFNDGRCESAGCLVLVQDDIFTSFINKLTFSFEKLKFGNSLSNADLPSIIRKSNEAAIGSQIIEAVKKENAKVISVQDYPDNGILHEPPSMVWDIQTSSKIFEEQVGGQFLTVLPFRTAKEAITMFNHGRHGDVSIWSEEIAPVYEVADMLQSSTVWVNCQNLYDATVFGGVLNGTLRGSAQLALFHFMSTKKESNDKSTNSDDKSKRMLLKSTGRPSKTYELYYGGQWKKPESNMYYTVYDSQDLPVAQVPESSGKDICNAVASAVSVQMKWRNLSPFRRSQILFRAAENLEMRKDDLISGLQVSSRQTPEECAKEFSLAIEKLFYWAAYCDTLCGSVEVTQVQGKVLQNYEPTGVVAVICPDEYPLLSFVSLLAPLVALGSAVVAVPSVTCPIPALIACQVFDISGIPSGIVNAVTMLDFHLTEHFARHMQVNSIWFPAGFKSLHESLCDALAVTQTRVFEYEYCGDEWLVHDETEAMELVFHATYSKTIWVPAGDIFAN